MPIMNVLRQRILCTILDIISVAMAAVVMRMAITGLQEGWDEVIGNSRNRKCLAYRQ